MTAAGTILGLFGVVMVVGVAGPLVYADTKPEPRPSVTCPAAPQRLPGHHFGPGDDLIQADLICADLRGAVFDGLDLTQARLSRADLRGASLRHTSLIQANLIEARLTGADLSFADLSQADLSRADLRGAHLWLAGSIQTTTQGVRLGPLERGAPQVAYLLIPAALLFLAAPVLRLLRRRPSPARQPGAWLRPRVRLLLVLMLATPPGAGLLWLMFEPLVALWFVALLRPLLLAEAILLLALLVELMPPNLFRRRGGLDLFTVTDLAVGARAPGKP